MSIKSYRDLIAWQKAMSLCADIYKTTAGFPKHEIYGLVQQLRRAAVSVPSNIAEGWGRACRADYIRFLRTARGSLFELETQMLLALRLAYVKQENADCVLPLAEEVGRVLQGLITSLERQTSREALPTDA